MSLPAEYKPKKNFSLIRLGRDNDGGYLIGYNTIKNTKSLISFGILDDCSFENDFKRKNCFLELRPGSQIQDPSENAIFF